MINFSIVITTFQRNDGRTPEYLRRALESIFKQDYQNFKIYVIGDKYENDSEFISIFKGFPSDKIHYENLPFAYERDRLTDKTLIWKYAGCFANNYGINKAISDGFEYVCHLDHDDEWYQNHLSSLNDAIMKTNSLWLCTKSKYLSNRILPNVNSELELIPYYPQPEGLIHSSTCINFKKIHLRHKSIIDDKNVSGLPGDADMWIRISNYFKETNQKGILINKITCVHSEEGYVRK